MSEREDERRQSEVGAFLRAMRARLRPEDVGLVAAGRRRTPGLRRQEVAELAAVSVDWYIRLEQGKSSAPGSSVLEGIASALRLSPAEREYLHLTARGEAPPQEFVASPVTPSLRAVLDGMPLLPAYIVDHCFDVLACNGAALAMFGEGFGSAPYDNSARILFLDPEARESQLSWERVARETVGALRANLARHRSDERLRALVAELREGSPEFAVWWDDQTVEERTRGVKQVRHPVVGDLAVSYDFLGIEDGSDQHLVVVTPLDPFTERALRELIGRRAEGIGIRRLVAVGG